MTATRAEILAAINAAPNGLTSAGLAEQLDSTAYNVSGVLSKLYAYGHISREPAAGRYGAVYRWKPKS